MPGFRKVRRAALSVHPNIAEGCSRKSKPGRKRFFEIARGSVIGIAHKLSYATLEQLQSTGDSIVKTFKLLSGMIARQEADN